MDGFALLRGMHFLFLGVFAFVILVLLFKLHSNRRERYFPGLMLFIILCFSGLLLHQTAWQLTGFRSTKFHAFLRRYDKRPDTIEMLSGKRGRILDRNGKILSEAVPDSRWKRNTPLGAAGTPLLGYSSQKFGLSGLERVLDTVLSGFDAELDTNKIEKRNLKRAKQGQDIRLTIDADLQKFSYDLLKGRKGAIVVLNPQNGEILALVSSPSVATENIFDAMKDSENAVLFNRALKGLYAPGSVFKIFTAAVAIEENKTPKMKCPEKGWIPAPFTPPIRDTHHLAGIVDLSRAFAESSNMYFAKIAQMCGNTAFQEYAKKANLKKEMTIAYQFGRTMDSAVNIFPSLRGKENNVAYLGFGQGELRMSPLSIACLTASIANGGFWVNPTAIQKQSSIPTRIWSKKTAADVAMLMRRSVQDGTSRGCRISGLEVCGKTGTAENGSGKDHAWFTCFAPMQNPKIAVTVLIENGGFGAVAALPVAKEILKKFFKDGTK